LYPGSVDPWSLTGGARGPLAGRPRWHRGQAARPWRAPAGGHGGGAPARETKGEKGPLGPWAHQELAGEVDGVGGGPVAVQSAAAQSAAAELGSAWRNGDGGGVSGLLRSIPYARRRREARRS
jgi:hypothetical protein